MIEMDDFNTRGIPGIGVKRLASFGLTTSGADELSRFYEKALGFRRLAAGRRSGSDFERLMGVESGAHSITLSVGCEIVELLQFDRPGNLYPAASASSDLCFQHFAIVVADIQPAYQRLSSVGGWTAISIGGPQQLPASSGGVMAFKFRDPDGHPLELLAFPDGNLPKRWSNRSEGDLFLGIDHSAISVYDTGRSIAFYKALGLHAAAHSLNVGPEQERLDAVSDVKVEVTGLEPQQATPHVELLCYRSVTHNRKVALRTNDVAATRLVFEADRTSSDAVTTPQAFVDPDGHHLAIVALSIHPREPKR